MLKLNAVQICHECLQYSTNLVLLSLQNLQGIICKGKRNIARVMGASVIIVLNIIMKILLINASSGINFKKLNN